MGPINLAVVKVVLKNGFRPAFAVGAGGAFMDLVYFLIVFFGLSYFTFSSHTKLIFKIIGVFILLGFGMIELLRKPMDMNPNSLEIPSNKNLTPFFILGLVLYMTNPTLIATISAVGATLKSFELFPDTNLNYVVISLGAGCGSALWYYTLASLMKKYTRKVTVKVLNRINHICGVFILGLAIYVGLQMADLL
ncbi:MAG: LysE family transporter [Deltaproteobacteria bacterium]|nr:LysE family transporter [Deltaproteobacteria bacterium]